MPITNQKELLKASKINLLLLLLEYCNEKMTNENLAYINNNFFHYMAGQLYLSYISGSCGNGYLNKEQVGLVKFFVSKKWDGTKKNLDELMNLF